jgi:hypothetical protein
MGTLSCSEGKGHTFESCRALLLSASSLVLVAASGTPVLAQTDNASPTPPAAAVPPRARSSITAARRCPEYIEQRLLQPEPLERLLSHVLDRRTERAERRRSHIADHSLTNQAPTGLPARNVLDAIRHEDCDPLTFPKTSARKARRYLTDLLPGIAFPAPGLQIKAAVGFTLTPSS